MAIHKGKIRQRNSGGTYDYLLPETTIDMVNGLQDELDGFNQQIDQNKTINGKSLREFGAIPLEEDPNFDSTLAIQSALDSDFDIKCNSNETYFFTNTLQCHKLKNIHLDGTLIYGGTNDKQAFIVGKYSNQNNNVSFNFNKRHISLNIKTKNTFNEDRSNYNYKLITLINLSFCTVDISAVGGHKGVSLEGEKRGFYANDIYLKNLSDSIYLLTLDAMDGGYVNGNIFYKGSFSVAFNNPNPTETTSILMTRSNVNGVEISNNLFIKPTFGTRGGQPIKVEFGYHNTFKEIRAENGSPLKNYVYSTTDTDYTDISYDFSVDEGKSVEFPWLGRSVLISPTEKFTKTSFIELYNWNYNPKDFIMYRTTSTATNYRTRILGLDTIPTNTNNVNPINHTAPLANMPLYDSGVYISGGRMGVWVDTRECKYITIRLLFNDYQDSSIVQPTFKPFDTSGNLITTGTGVDLTGIMHKPYYLSSNNEYEPGIKTITYGIKLSENVKTLFIGVRSTDAVKGRLQGMKIYGTEQAYVYTKRKFGLDSPNHDIHGCLSIGDYIPNYDLTQYSDNKGNYIIKGYLVTAASPIDNYKLTTVPEKIYI